MFRGVSAVPVFRDVPGCSRVPGCSGVPGCSSSVLVFLVLVHADRYSSFKAVYWFTYWIKVGIVLRQATLRKGHVCATTKRVVTFVFRLFF